MRDGERERPVVSLRDAMRRRQDAKAKRGGRVHTMNVEHFPAVGERRRYTIVDMYERRMRNRWREGEEEFVVCLSFHETDLVLPLEDERLDAVLVAGDTADELRGRHVEVWLEEKRAKDGKTPLGGRWPYKRMVRVVDWGADEPPIAAVVDRQALDDAHDEQAEIEAHERWRNSDDRSWGSDEDEQP